LWFYRHFAGVIFPIDKKVFSLTRQFGMNVAIALRSSVGGGIMPVTALEKTGTEERPRTAAGRAFIE
jgi:hypothetical protein